MIGDRVGEAGQQSISFDRSTFTVTKPSTSTVYLGGLYVFASPGSQSPPSPLGQINVAHTGALKTFTLTLSTSSYLGAERPRTDTTMSVNIHQMSYTVA